MHFFLDCFGNSDFVFGKVENEERIQVCKPAQSYIIFTSKREFAEVEGAITNCQTLRVMECASDCISDWKLGSA